MSYILDALRRADAERERERERERDAVPGLNAQPAPAFDAVRPLRRMPAAGLWLALGAALGVAGVVAGVVALVWLPRPAPAPPQAPQAPLQVPSSMATPAPLPASPRAVAAPLAVAAPPRAPASAPASALPSAPPSAPPAETRLIKLAELPAELKREWPPLAIGGAIYSDSAASRFIIVGGQVVREGESAAPGVVVERIGPKSALLRWRELRVEVPF